MDRLRSRWQTRSSGVKDTGKVDHFGQIALISNGAHPPLNSETLPCDYGASVGGGGSPVQHQQLVLVVLVSSIRYVHRQITTATCNTEVGFIAACAADNVRK
ncbi:hypothetical protein TYRP_008376 [Tyrophagus putrescentiae]|nr:hypothetical protein TYRP_008376 [Tyrophagus putrescentiae]